VFVQLFSTHISLPCSGRAPSDSAAEFICGQCLALCLQGGARTGQRVYITEGLGGQLPGCRDSPGTTILCDHGAKRCCT